MRLLKVADERRKSKMPSMTDQRKGKKVRLHQSNPELMNTYKNLEGISLSQVIIIIYYNASFIILFIFFVSIGELIVGLRFLNL